MAEDTVAAAHLRMLLSAGRGQFDQDVIVSLAEGDVVDAVAHLEAAAGAVPRQLLTGALLARLHIVVGVVFVLKLEQHQLQVAVTAQGRQDEPLND